jgi:murein tripeptide amidase MpaA
MVMKLYRLTFFAGSEGIPRYDDRLKELEDSFKAAMFVTTPEFQDTHGYPKDEPGQANLTVGSCWIGQEFDCLSYTIEMPFKDNNELPDLDYGWSDRRSYSFGQDTLSAILSVVDKLR